MKRLFKISAWIVGLAAVLLVIAWIAVAAILASDLPRTKAVEAIEAATGFHAEIDELRITWGGRTTLHGFSLRGPLDAEPVVQFEEVVVDHTSLINILLTQDLSVDQVTLQNLTARLKQRIDGRWNVQDLIDHIQSDSSGQSNALPPIPPINVDGVRVLVDMADGRSLDVSPVSVKGKPDGTVAYHVDLEWPDHIRVQTKLALGGNWKHEVQFEIAQLAEQLKPWWPDAPSEIASIGKWEGRVSDGFIVGRATLQESRVGPYRASGAVTVRAGAEQIEVSPSQLELLADEGPIDNLLIQSAILRYTNGSLKLSDATVHAMESTIHADVELNLQTMEGKINANVNSDFAEQKIKHATYLAGDFNLSKTEALQFKLKGSSSGSTLQGKWDADINLDLKAASASKADLQLGMSSVSWTSNTDVKYEWKGVLAQAAMEDTRVSISSFSTESHPTLTLTGSYAIDEKRWMAEAAAADFTAPAVQMQPLDFRFKAQGTFSNFDVTELAIDQGDSHIAGSLSFDPKREMPILGDINAKTQFAVKGDPPVEAAAAEAADQSAPATNPTVAQSNQHGSMLAFEGKLNGTINPLQLEMTGQLDATGIVANRHKLADIRTPLQVNANASSITLRTETVDLFDGKGRITVQHDLAKQQSNVTLSLDKVSLARFAPLIQEDLDIKGTLRADLRATLDALDLQNVDILGNWTVSNFAYGEVQFDRLQGDARTVGDQLVLDPITITHQDGNAKGIVKYNLKDGRTVHADLQLVDWPHELTAAKATLKINGRANVQANLKNQQAFGSLDASSSVHIDGKPIGSVTLKGEITEKQVTFSNLRAQLLQGSIEGNANIDLINPHQSIGDLRWQGVRLNEAAVWANAFAAFDGAVAGRLTFGPAKETRPMEPMRYDLSVDTSALTYQRIPIGAVTAYGYIGDRRMLIQEASVVAAEGKASVWLSATKHDQRWHSQTVIKFDSLNLDVIAGALASDKDPKPMPGRLSGEVRLLLPINDLTNTSGRGNLQLAESDLANLNFVGLVLSTIGVKFGNKLPEGRGHVRFNIEQGNLRVDRFRYYNRGVDMFGSGSIEQLFSGSAAQIDFGAAGVQRPFRDLNLPLLDKFDEVFGAAQTNLTTVQVRGTLAEPSVQLAPISSLGTHFRRFFNRK